MTRKFTILLMALLALAGFKSWGQQALPYSYGFENNDLSAAGWTMVNYSTANPLGISNQDHYTGNYSFCFSSLNKPAPYDQYLISPQISASSNFVLQFYHKSDSWAAEAFQVGYSTTNGDISSFTFGTTIYNPNDSDWHLSEEFNFPVDTKYVAIHYCSQWLYNFYVDDFTFTAFNSCPKPKDLAASNITGTGATITWSGSADSYKVVYGPAEGFNPDDITPVVVSETTYTINNLTTDVTYSIAVKAVCGAGEESDWSQTYSFTPTCPTVNINQWNIETTAVTANIPWNVEGYAESFSLAYGLADGFNLDDANTYTLVENITNAYYELSNLAAGTEYKCAVNALCDGNTEGNWSNVVSFTPSCPAPSLNSYSGINLTPTTATISWNSNKDFIENYTLVYGLAETFDLENPNTYNSVNVVPDEYGYASYTIQNLTTNVSYKCAARSSCDGSTQSVWSNVVTFMPFIEAPNGLTVSNIKATSVTASWDASENAVTYTVAYGLANGFNLNDPTTYQTTEPTSATSVEITGLTADQNYACAVKSTNAESIDSKWSNPVYFMPTAKQTLVANDGTNYYSHAPFYGGGIIEGMSSGQFIIPASELQQMSGSSILSFEFSLYSSPWHQCQGNWEVYLEEVENTTYSSASFIEDNIMQLVYSGDFYVSDKLSVTFTTPFEYNGGNLMVYFKQTQAATSSDVWTPWYGVETSDYTSIGYEDYNYQINLYRYNFLPKTTITYIPAEKFAITLMQPEDEDEIGTIAAYVNGVEVSQASEGTEITLQYNFNLGYRFLNWIVNGEPIQGNTFTMPATAVTVAVNYETLTQYDINCATLDEGTIHAEYNGVTITKAPAGTEITLVAEANTGYSFDHFIVNGEPIDGNTYTMPDSEITVSATFLLAHTVYNGSSDNDHHPFYVYYADDFTKSNMIMPAADLADMAGGTISSMKFYVSRTVDYMTLYCNSNWQVYLKEVDENETSAPIDVTTATKVYEGVIDFKVDEVIINFTEPFAYNGGNLLIATQNTTDVSYSHVYFYGSDNAYGYNCSGYNTDGSSLNNITTWPQNKKSKFLPKTTFIYTPGATRYSVICDNEITGGSISADPVKAAAGTVVNLSATPAFGYEFGAWVEDYEDVTIENNQFTMPEHDVNISATFSELTKYAINSAIVAGGTVHAEYNNVTITEAFAGTEITLVAEAATDYIFEYFTVDGVQIEGNTYTMGTSAIEIGASFRQLQSYTITYYVNGSVQKTLHPKENAFISIVEPSSTVIPAGTTFAGWSREDITTYQTTEPVFVGNTEHPTEDCSLYAVLSYSEMGGATAWTKVTNFSELQNGNKVVIAAMNGENTGYTLNESCEFTGTSTCSALSATFDNAGATIAALPEGTTQFTVGLNPNFAYYLSLTGENGDLVYWDYNLNVPAGVEPETTNNLFRFNDSKLVAGYNPEDWDDLFVILHNYDSYDGTNMRFGVEQIQPGYYDAAYLYKQQGALATYYMTEVFVIDEATSLTEDMTKRNVIIADGASLNINANVTLNVAGACFNPSHDATKFVVAEGGQLVHHNEGTVATFEKNITGYTNAQGNDGYYLIANPTNEKEVANLVNEDGYDLYTFNPAQALEWNNEKASNALTSGIGYLYANNETVTLKFAGELTPAGSTDVDLIYAEEGDGIDFPGFNLIGNPYACNAYVGKSFYVIQGTELKLSENAYVAPCEGFFVEAAEDDLSVTLSTTAPEPARLLSLTVSQNRGNVIDRAIVRFDGANDLHKFMLNPDHTNIRLAKHGEEFAAISSEAEGEIPVSFKAEKNGSYTITVNTENVNAHYIHLIDNLTGADVDLLSTPSYTFNASTSDYAYRFKLVFSMTGVEENESNANSYAYISNGNLVIDHIEGEATMQIVDMLGRVVSTEIVSGSYNKALNLKAGLYIINLNGMTQKIVVK